MFKLEIYYHAHLIGTQTFPCLQSSYDFIIKAVKQLKASDFEVICYYVTTKSVDTTIPFDNLPLF